MKYLLLVAVSLLSVFSYGQSKKFIFKLGSEYELPRKSEDLSFFGNQTDGIINLSLKKDELNVVRFDPKTLSQSTEKKIELPEATKNFNSEAVTDFSSTNYFWMHSDWDKESKIEMLFYDKIDVASGKLTNQNTKMFETTRLTGDMVSTGFYQMKVDNKYKFNYDAEKKKLLVSYRLWPEEKNDKINYDRIGLQIFDENLKKLWGGEFTMPYTEAIMDNSNFSVDGNGNAYMLAKIYDSEKRKEKDKETGKPAYHYEVLKFTKDSKKIISATIAVDDFFIRETSLIENFKHEMIIASTYSKRSKGNGTDGVFLASLDQNNKVIKFKDGYYEFPLAELEKFESARKKRKMEKSDDYEAPNLVVRDVILETDGSVLMALEEYNVVVTRSYGSRGQVTTYATFYYEDIIAGKINAAGKFEWLRKIPKKQKGSTTNSGYSVNYNLPGTMGFKLISDASGYYFLYLDNKKNVDIAEDEVPKYHVDGFGGQVMVTKVDNTGTLAKELLFDTREEDVMVFPKKFSRINGNQFIGRAKVKKNLFQPLLITVN